MHTDCRQVTFSISRLFSSTQAAWAKMVSMFGKVAGVWTFAVQMLQVVKTNMAIYSTQKVADSKIADSVFFSHALELFNGFPDCVQWQARQCFQNQLRSAGGQTWSQMRGANHIALPRSNFTWCSVMEGIQKSWFVLLVYWLCCWFIGCGLMNWSRLIGVK